MTLGKLFKEAADRIKAGEADLSGLVSEYTGRVLADAGMTHQAVRELVHKRLSDALSGHIKPAGKTARVPAGQTTMWGGMEPLPAIKSMRRYIKQVAGMKGRADKAAAVLGYIDSSGLEPSEYPTLLTLCVAADVPEELIAALAA